MSTKKPQFYHQKYECKQCDFSCSKQRDYERHLSTDKHKKGGKINSLSTNSDILPPKAPFICDLCNKTYKERTGLWKHKKTCINTNSVTTIDPALTTLMLDLVKSNQELQQQMVELCKNGANNTTNNTMNNTINSNNKSFNLNVFLNETCKDAMNMKDFVDSIQITLADIENMGKLGFVNGISNIIVNRLKAIDVHLRPVHCTDQRRETMYVKEKNKWNKEEEDNKNIRTFIQLVAHKNTKNLSLFKNKHPDCLEYHSKYNDQYNKIVMETFGGYGNTDYDSENKIIRKLVKELAIDKS